MRDGNPTPCRPVIYLCRAVARGLKRSTPRQMGEQPIRSSRPQGPEQRSTAGILDLATHQTVRRANSRWRPVGSYPAFSPLPPLRANPTAGRFFSVTLLYPHGYQVIGLRGALRCPDFPPPVARRRWSGPAGQRYE